MKRSKYEILKIQTKNYALVWKDVNGIADSQVANKMDTAMLDWIVELTNCLTIWIEKGQNMTVGELILARANLGALVESWLKFFYCVFYIDYLKNPKRNRNGTIIEPNNMRLEDLKRFSIGILWEDIQDKEYIWVEKIQYMRNAIHIFNYRDIGDNNEFMNDLETYYDFVDNIISHFPPIEDYLECYPQGYVMNVYFD